MRLTKWTGLTSSNSFLGNSTIFESKEGLVGIGTDAPTSRLTVAGTIRSLSGGLQFPDGTVQTTSAAGSLFAVAHDATLMGDGTPTAPLGVAVPLTLTGSLPGGVITVVNSTGIGVVARGGDSDFQGGTGVEGTGVAAESQGGHGVRGRGGEAIGNFPIGGYGVYGTG